MPYNHTVFSHQAQEVIEEMITEQLTKEFFDYPNRWEHGLSLVYWIAREWPDIQYIPMPLIKQVGQYLHDCKLNEDTNPNRIRWGIAPHVLQMVLREIKPEVFLPQEEHVML